MTQSTNSVQRLSRKARRAVLVRHAQNQTGRFCVWTLSAAIVVTLIGRLFPQLPPVPWWWGTLALVMLSVVLGVVWAVRHSPSLVQSAGLLDDRLRLNSRLRSALELGDARGASGAGFVEWAVHDAEALSEGLDVRAVQDAPLTRRWWLCLLLLGAIVGIGVWVPVRDNTRKAPKPVLPARAIAGIDAAEEMTRQLGGEDTPASVQDELEALNALRAELEQGVRDENEADARTAAQLEELARAIDDESELSREQAQQISDSIEAARNRSLAQEDRWDPRIDEFARSLGSQRFDVAAQQIEELNESVDSMTPEERARLAEQLEELADAIEPQPTPLPPNEGGAKDEDPHLSEQFASPDDPSNQSETSTEPTRDSQPQRQQEPATPDPQRDLSESLREQAQRVREPQKNPGGDASPEPGPAEPQPNDASQTSEKEADQQPEPAQNGEQPPQGSQQGENESVQEQRSETDDNRSQTRPQDTQSPSDQQGQTQAEPADQSEERQGSQGQSSDTDEDRPQGREQPGQGQRRSLEERLRELDRQQQGARRNQEQAEQLREEAQRLMRDQSQTMPDSNPQEPQGAGESPMPPDSQQGEKRGAGDGERAPNTPQLGPDQRKSEFVPIDGRDPDAGGGGQPVGKWYAPEGEPLDPTQSGQTAQRFRRASEQAQRAIDEQQVPRRYRHLVREVFDRVTKRADAIEGTGTIAPQGKDASPTKATGSAGSSQ